MTPSWDGEGGADDEPRRLLADQAETDALVVADPLERAAEDRQVEPQAGGGDADRGRPLIVLDADRLGDRFAREDRDHGQGERHPSQRSRPPPQRDEQAGADAEVAEHRLARGRDLHRLPDHAEDQEVADQRRERGVVVEQPREHDGRPERDHVVDDHREGQTARLGRVGLAQVAAEWPYRRLSLAMRPSDVVGADVGIATEGTERRGGLAHRGAARPDLQSSRTDVEPV